MSESENKNNASNELLSVMNTVQYEKFYELANKEYLISCEPVLVYTIATDGNSAKIVFPSDPSSPSSFYYANRTGGTLTVGQKVYLQHKVDDTSQGWLVNNTALNLQPKLSTIIGTITAADSSISILNSSVKQYGNVVCVNFWAYKSDGFTTGSTAFTYGILSGISMPSSLTTLNPIANSIYAFGDAFLNIQGSIYGHVYVQSGYSVNAVYFNFSYIVS